MYRHCQSRTLNSVLFPAVGVAGFALALQGGGATPDGGQPSLGMSVSAKVVTWGEPVTVSGRSGALRPGSRVRILLRPDGGSAFRVAEAIVGRNRTWKASFRPRQEGFVLAVSGAGSAVQAAGADGHRLDLALKVDGPGGTVGGRPGTRVPVSARVQPAVRTGWVQERWEGGRWQKVSTGRSSASGQISTTVPVTPAGSRTRLRVVGARSLAGNVGEAFTVKPLRPAMASWYNLYGGGLACGGTLKRTTLGVAHKTLKCGTRVAIHYRGRSVTVPVIDRGPFIAGREFDLTGATAERLGFEGVGVIWVSP